MRCLGEMTTLGSQCLPHFCLQSTDRIGETVRARKVGSTGTNRFGTAVGTFPRLLCLLLVNLVPKLLQFHSCAEGGWEVGWAEGWLRLTILTEC